MSMLDAAGIAKSEQTLHSGLWRESPRLAQAHIGAALAGGLALDSWLGWTGQIAGDAWAAAVLGWLLLEGGSLERRALLTCVLIATLGEVFLSLVWGLYDYQFHNI